MSSGQTGQVVWSSGQEWSWSRSGQTGQGQVYILISPFDDLIKEGGVKSFRGGVRGKKTQGIQKNHKPHPPH